MYQTPSCSVYSRANKCLLNRSKEYSCWELVSAADEYTFGVGPYQHGRHFSSDIKLRVGDLNSGLLSCFCFLGGKLYKCRESDKPLEKKVLYTQSVQKSV